MNYSVFQSNYFLSLISMFELVMVHLGCITLKLHDQILRHGYSACIHMHVHNVLCSVCNI